MVHEMDLNEGEAGMSCSLPAPSDQMRSRAGNMVFKSGPLFVSSKGIGWTQWKKRWFILTRTSLVFFRSDPSIIPQKGSEVNLTLGGIDLNNSGSVVVREDKKLLTVLFPDGSDGRAFTLKAETSEDLNDWKTALENALTQAPNAALLMGQNGIFRNDSADIVDVSSEQLTGRDRQPVKSMVVGRPVLLALEDVDGSPSFLEKALIFIEEYGVKVEGILRQAADVDDVEHRIQEYEQGKTDFSPEEDAHVIADCIKYILRELPSYPVPASCCNALLDAWRTVHGSRVKAIRIAIADTFPEPNRLLLQRILKMMQAVVSRKLENRMSTPAVAACMAPLLLRPLLAGDCQPDNSFNMGGGDGSAQLLQAAAAANHAQAIVIAFMEEYDKIFGEDNGALSPKLYSESEGSSSRDEELTDEDEDEVLEDGKYPDSEDDLDPDAEDASSGSATEASVRGDDHHHYDDKKSNEADKLMPQHENAQSDGGLERRNINSIVNVSTNNALSKDVSISRILESKSAEHSPLSRTKNIARKYNESTNAAPRRTILGRTSARRNLSTESIDFTHEDEVAILKLESAKTDLQIQIAKKAKENEVLYGSLERLKQALQEQRSTLEQDVTRLQERLQKDKYLKKTMEAEFKTNLRELDTSEKLDDEMKAKVDEIARTEVDVANLKQKVADLHMQLNQQGISSYMPVCESCSQLQQSGPQAQTIQDSSEPTYTARLGLKSTTTKDSSPQAENEKVKIQDPPLLPKIKTAEKQQQDSAVHGSTKKSSGATTVSSAEPITIGAVPNNKKSSGKIEGAVTTTSALSKLTNRLNFLKERRTQIVNELQNIEYTKPSEVQSLGVPSRTTSR